MSTQTIAVDSLAIAGSGTMGQGIAIVAAQSGLQVMLYDLGQAQLDTARQRIERFTQSGVDKGKTTPEARRQVLDRIGYTSRLDDLKAPLVLEAIPEQLELKQAFFAHMEQINPAHTILATNTSSIPVTQIAAGLQHPERVAGLHFFNPAPLMKLVEVISAESTDPAVIDALLALCARLGKTAAVVKDTPGFIVNRVARHYYLESLHLLQEGVANHETIDALMENAGFRMGPFRLMDLIGVDTNHSVTQSMYAQFFQEPRFRPSRIQQKKVEAGHWGQKSGRGFYTYEKK
ncbi:MAG: 3-hydroxybutyryl-CoA dehydrogenase [Bacteroidetes bacterium]|nr:3-hydroxybutyryl-CoA dehydrogenase [Bacteroidota bacterium]